MVGALQDTVCIHRRFDYWLTAGLALLLLPVAQVSRMSFKFPTTALGPLVAGAAAFPCVGNCSAIPCRALRLLFTFVQRDWRRFHSFYGDTIRGLRDCLVQHRKSTHRLAFHLPNATDDRAPCV